MPRVTPFSAAYVPHLLSSLALTSIAIHLVRQRNAATTDRAHLSAQISILESTVGRLRAGERIPPPELDRVLRLARSQTEEQGEETIVERMREKEGEIGWKEVFLGRKPRSKEEEETARKRQEMWDLRDLETIASELSAAIESR
ncbi:uncharacterized protein LAESUDRAFT_761511 [Laetiporus sulphureus 93-53]|uniref:Uncharacterized protein n=1 Tax=Laetiporus sulphureus 93-53 TaxID=1314785 RepID=A0A165D100_9APHY|nr:uncharacterized protein LAESUDRAFT_761511 [Laetiporus sulphureus 93-53]KZT03916.1 hypothetical protein LAESUDRAFT_761511 [Laetiporus sulphureus 93-53]